MRFFVFIILLGVFNGFAQKKVILSDKAPKPIGPYSQAVQNGNTLYLSGQIALKADGSMDTSSIENETRLVMENLKAVLEAAELDFKHVLKTTIYMTDLKKFKQMNEVYGSYFSSEPPARETVEVRALPKGAHIEISMIAKFIK